MNKKDKRGKYIVPEIKVVSLNTSHVLCSSGVNSSIITMLIADQYDQNGNNWFVDF